MENTDFLSNMQKKLIIADEGLRAIIRESAETSIARKIAVKTLEEINNL